MFICRVFEKKGLQQVEDLRSAGCCILRSAECKSAGCCKKGLQRVLLHSVTKKSLQQVEDLRSAECCILRYAACKVCKMF